MMSGLPPPRARGRRGGDLLRSLGAVCALLLVVAGVPLLLAWTIGWPLPRELPSIDRLRAVLSSGNGIPDDAIVKGVAALAWIYWAHFSWCVLVEARAIARGRIARPVPLGGVNQALASRLVAAALMVLPANGMLASAAFAGPARAPAAVVRVDARPSHQTESPDHPQSDPDQGPARSKVYQVRRGDTLWDIAKRHLPPKDPARRGDPRHPGDPLRWRELFELNRGRHQPDGTSLTDPHWIFPGWELLLPPDAIGLPERRAAPPREGDAAGPSQPGAKGGQPATSSPSSSTAQTPGTGGQASTTSTVQGDWGLGAPGDGSATTATTVAPGVPLPGGAVPPSFVSPPQPTRPPERTATTEPAPSGDGAAAPTNGSRSGESDLIVPAAAFGAGLLAFGLLVVIARRRRTGQRERGPDEPVPTPPPTARPPAADPPCRGAARGRRTPRPRHARARGRARP